MRIYQLADFFLAPKQQISYHSFRGFFFSMLIDFVRRLHLCKLLYIQTQKTLSCIFGNLEGKGREITYEERFALIYMRKCTMRKSFLIYELAELLQKGGFCNGCITKRIRYSPVFPSGESQYIYLENRKKHLLIYYFHHLS